MRVQTRSATTLDLWRIATARGRQRVLRLDPLSTLVYPEPIVWDHFAPRLPGSRPPRHLFTCVDAGRVLGWVETRYRSRRKDEWTLTAIGSAEGANDAIWEPLFEEMCAAASEGGVTRIFAQVARDELLGADLRALGFTHYANEQLWAKLLGSSHTAKQEPERKPLRPQTDADAWDLMQLYSAITPPAVRRAEDPNVRAWRKGHVPIFSATRTAERGYVWADEANRGSGLGGHVRLLSGPRGHWIRLMCRSDHANRARCPLALDYVLWKAARVSDKPVYCGVREYGQETAILLEERGFHPLGDRELLVKYLARPIEVKQPALVPFLTPNREMAATGDRWSAAR
jgi:hypothetical protein